MACDSRYAEAWEFVSFWCRNSLVVGADNSGGAGNASLEDTNAKFVGEHNITANVGMVLYNLTDGSSGPVTAVADTTITATLTGGTTNLWSNGDRYRIVPITAVEIGTTENFLDIIASNIWIALASVDACDCSLSTAAVGYLNKLNIIEAGALYQCPCMGLTFSDDQRRAYLEWANEQLRMIRDGEIELCDGETGANYPAVAIAQQSVTEFAAAQIIADDFDRNTT